MSVVFGVEKMAECRTELGYYFPRHWEEVALSKESIKLNIDWARYEDLEKFGILRILTARKDGKLIGYFIGWLSENPHYKGCPMMFTDIYYLDPAHRDALTGFGLFRFVEQKCREWGVVKMTTVTKLHRDVSPLFLALGWTEVERTFTKYIGPSE